MIKTDCINFKLDRPCGFHKETGIHCSSCNKYISAKANQSTSKQILIIKLDAMGDVLRTTFLLPGIKQLYPDSSITWIVAPESVAILEGNPYIAKIWIFDKNIFSKLLSTRFDLAINLDLSPSSLTLSTMSFAGKKIGFWLDKNRKIICSNTFARKWLDMSAFDDKKKENKNTYQYWMAKITGLPRTDYKIFVPLKKESVVKAKRFAEKNKLKGKMVVGINPGAGKRWKLKRWSREGYLNIIKQLTTNTNNTKQDVKVLLFGGPGEEKLIDYLTKKSNYKAVNTGINNTIPDFFALVNLCDLFITGDTLALHTAIGLGKKVIAIFGPTSAQEIETYGQGMKIVSSLSCVCCYNQECSKKPNCMDTITPKEVLSAIETQWLM